MKLLKFFRFSSTAAVMVLLSVVAICSLLGYFSQYHLVCELLSHLRFVYLAAASALVAPAVLIRSRIVWISAILLVAFTALPLVPLFYSDRNDSVTSDAVHVKILQANLWGGKNRNFDGVAANVRKYNPDIFVVSEITQLWEDYLVRKLPEFKFRKIENRFGGVAIFSKLPLTDAKIEYFGKIRRPRIEATIQANGASFFLIAAHTVIPLPKFSNLRNEELEVLAERASSSRLPAVLAGDLNCSPWSFYFDKLLIDGQLLDSERGFGIEPSWPTRLLGRIEIPTCMPIDHLLVSKNVAVLSRQIGDRDGSDHLPVYAEIALHSNKK